MTFLLPFFLMFFSDLKLFFFNKGNLLENSKNHSLYKALSELCCSELWVITSETKQWLKLPLSSHDVSFTNFGVCGLTHFSKDIKIDYIEGLGQKLFPIP